MLIDLASVGQLILEAEGEMYQAVRHVTVCADEG
jgi:hypothetical protein